MSPYEKVHGRAFDYDRLHVPLCLCYYLLPERDRTSKLSPRSLPAMYLGEDDQRHGHEVYVPGLQRFTSAYHVVFNEHRYYNSTIDSRVTFTDQKAVGHDPIGKTKRYYREERDDPDVGTLPDDDVTDAPTRLRDDLPLNPANDPRHGTDDN